MLSLMNPKTDAGVEPQGHAQARPDIVILLVIQRRAVLERNHGCEPK
jgi:hypothetical protein